MIARDINTPKLMDFMLIMFFSISMVGVIIVSPTLDTKSAAFKGCLPAEPTPEQRFNCTRIVYGEEK